MRSNEPGAVGRHQPGTMRTPVRPPPAPMARSRPQGWTVVAASAGSVLATALLLFAGG